MKRIQSRSRLKAVFLVPILLVGLGVGPRESAHKPVPEFSQRINAFTLDFLETVARSSQGNLVLSPQSLFHGLAMGYVASGAETRTELARVLHFPEDNQSLIRELSSLRAQFVLANRHPGIELHLANGVWMDQAYATFRNTYKQQLGRAFDGQLHSVKFRDGQGVSDQINAWITRETKGRIPGGVGPEDFESRSGLGRVEEPGLVTVNAVYFKARWAARFDTSETRKGFFHPHKGDAVSVSLMHQRCALRYAETSRLQFLELPYTDRLYSMCVVLPRENLESGQARALIPDQTLSELQRRAQPHQVDVLLPKFAIRNHANAKEALVTMGVSAAFDRQKADFDRMILKKKEAFRVYLANVFQDAWVEVDEEGSEAAAATSTTHYSVGCATVMPPPPATFHADHPFLFFIVHRESASVLFAGWVENPSIKEPRSPAKKP